MVQRDFCCGLELQLHTMVNKSQRGSSSTLTPADARRLTSASNNRADRATRLETNSAKTCGLLLSPPTRRRGEKKVPSSPFFRTPSALRHFRSATTSQRNSAIGPVSCQSELTPAPEVLLLLSQRSLINQTANRTDVRLEFTKINEIIN